MNVVSLIGRLGYDIELMESEGGNIYLRNVLAVRRDAENTDWVPIVAFGNTAELIANYHEKGDMIGITGRLEVRQYENEDNEKKTSYSVVVQRISFVGGTGSEEESEEETDYIEDEDEEE